MFIVTINGEWNCERPKQEGCISSRTRYIRFTLKCYSEVGSTGSIHINNPVNILHIYHSRTYRNNFVFLYIFFSISISRSFYTHTYTERREERTHRQSRWRYEYMCITLHTYYIPIYNIHKWRKWMGLPKIFVKNDEFLFILNYIKEKERCAQFITIKVERGHCQGTLSSFFSCRCVDVCTSSRFYNITIEKRRKCLLFWCFFWSFIWAN